MGAPLRKTAVRSATLFWLEGGRDGVVASDPMRGQTARYRTLSSGGGEADSPPPKASFLISRGVPARFPRAGRGRGGTGGGYWAIGGRRRATFRSCRAAGKGSPGTFRSCRGTCRSHRGVFRSRRGSCRSCRGTFRSCSGSCRSSRGTFKGSRGPDGSSGGAGYLTWGRWSQASRRWPVAMWRGRPLVRTGRPLSVLTAN